MNTRHSGADWLRGCRVTNISPLGEAVADLLGDLFAGLYHLDGAEDVDWSNSTWIDVRVAYRDWSTFDSDLLTRLVFLAHDRCLRAEINPRGHHSLTLRFHQRSRTGGIWARHPTIEQALKEHRRWHPTHEEIEA